jgi:hypothetical protein
MLRNLLLLLAAPTTSASNANAFATFIEETKVVDESNIPKSTLTERSNSAFEFVNEESKVLTENTTQLDAMTSLLLREGQLDELDEDELMKRDEGMNKRHAYKEKKKSGKATKPPTVSGKSRKEYTMSPTVHSGKPSGSTDENGSSDSGKSGKAINEEKQHKKAEKKKKKESETSNKKDSDDESVM